MTDTIHACGVDDCRWRAAWTSPPDVVSVRQAAPCEVVTICPCRLCDEHVSADEVAMIDARGRAYHLQCGMEALNDIDRMRDDIAAMIAADSVAMEWRTQ